MQPLVRRFDDHVVPDVRHVVEAAEVLEIREVEVFRYAHRCWFDRELGEAELDQTFADYLLRQQVPAWVRHYCRRVLNLAAVGQLDPRDFGVDGSIIVHRVTLTEQLHSALITLLAFLLYLLFIA